MRVPLFIALSLACGLAASCSRSGDFGGFVVQEVTKYGGRTKTNPILPKLDAHWTVKRDKNGFQATVSGPSFVTIDAFMQQAFGAPKMSIDGSRTDSGQPHKVWAAVDIGVAIHLIGRPDGADVICVRAMRDLEEMFREMEKPWWKKLW